VNLTAFSPAIEVLGLVSYQNRGLIGGDLWSRRFALVAPVAFAQLTANDYLLCLESYFSSALHRLIPSSSGETSIGGAGNSMALPQPFSSSFNEGLCDKINAVHIARPSRACVDDAADLSADGPAKSFTAA
jgi:hypothetical protein